MKVLIRSGLLVLMFFSLLAGPSSAASGADEHYSKAVEYASGGKFIQSREEFKEALKIDPRHSSAENSLKTIEDAIDLKVKKEAVMHNFKGVAFGNIGKWDRSISEITKAIEIDPKYADAHYNRGFAYDNKGQYDRAISDYTKAIEIDPGLPYAYNDRGTAYGKKGQYDRAISNFTKTLKIDPKNVTAYTNRGFAYEKKGQYDRAISDYTKAIEIDPKDASAYTNRGIVYMVNLDKGKKGCKDLKRACKLGECGYYELAKKKRYCR